MDYTKKFNMKEIKIPRLGVEENDVKGDILTGLSKSKST